MWQAGWRLQLQHRAATPMQGPFCTLGIWEKTVLQGASGKGRPQADTPPAPCEPWFEPPGGEALLWVILSDRPIHHFAFHVRAGSGFIQPWTNECSGNRWQNVKWMLSLVSWPFLLSLFSSQSETVSLHFQKGAHTQSSLFTSVTHLQPLSSHYSLVWVHQGKPSRVEQQNKRKACPAFWTGATRTYSVLTVLERMKHSWASWAIPFPRKKFPVTF